MPELAKATFGHVVRVQKIEICRFALGSALHVHERHEAKKESFSKVSRREHSICEAASRIDLRNQGAICKNVLCLRESFAVSIDHTPPKPSPRKGDVSKRLRKHTMRCGLSLP